MTIITNCGLIQVVTNKERRAMEEERVNLSTTLMVALPDLISKVQCILYINVVKKGRGLLGWSISSVGRASC